MEWNTADKEPRTLTLKEVDSAGPGPRLPAPARPKQFDTRILDRMEAYCDLYRHWLDGDHEMPHGYAESQREAYRRYLIETAKTLLDALSR